MDSQHRGSSQIGWGGVFVVVVLGIIVGSYTARDKLSSFSLGLSVDVQWWAHRLGQRISHFEQAFRGLASHHPKLPARASTEQTPPDVAGAALQKSPQTATHLKPSRPLVTLYLKNGGIVTGKLMPSASLGFAERRAPRGERKSSDEVILHWDYGDVGFANSEIERMVEGRHHTGSSNLTMPWEGTHREEAWAYRHDVVVQLLKGAVLDGRIVAVTPQDITLMHTLGSGGTAQQTIPRSEIERLLFRPVHSPRAQAIEKNLQEIFPQMRWYPEGMVTIVTDSIPPVVKEYRRAIQELVTDWYLTFHPLVSTRAPMVQHYVVIFEKWEDYIEYAASDGVPGWFAVGYFNPEDQVLYCFNMVGERFSQLLHDAFLGQFREARDRVSGAIRGSRDAVFIEGQMSEFIERLEQAHGVVRQMYSELGVGILRHELTHALFHNWNLQGVVLSQLPEVNEETLASKRQYLTAQDKMDKRRLLEELLSQQKGEAFPEIRADNSWFVEGLASYMEPSPVGSLNTQRLSIVQQALRENRIFPLESLHAFRLGSFSGMATQSMLFAYAQSWALTHFLMHHYPQGFMVYLDRLAKSAVVSVPEGPAQDTLPWLMEALGKEERALEQEFLEYLKQLPPENPFWMKEMQTFIDLHAELITLANQLWSR